MLEIEQRQPYNGGVSTEIAQTEVIEAQVLDSDWATKNAEYVKAQSERARRTLGDFTQRAVQILQELAEFAENDRIRLAAVNSILDRAGVNAPQEIKVTATQEEHALVKADAEETLARLQRNLEQRARPAISPSLEALVVHESEGD